MVVAVSLAIVVLVVPWIGRVDLRLVPPIGDDPPLVPTVLAYAVLTAGVGLVWRTGTTLHPDAPWSALGLALTFGGAALLARTARGRTPAAGA